MAKRLHPTILYTVSRFSVTWEIAGDDLLFRRECIYLIRPVFIGAAEPVHEDERGLWAGQIGIVHDYPIVFCVVDCEFGHSYSV